MLAHTSRNMVAAGGGANIWVIGSGYYLLPSFICPVFCFLLRVVMLSSAIRHVRKVGHFIVICGPPLHGGARPRRLVVVKPGFPFGA